MISPLLNPPAFLGVLALTTFSSGCATSSAPTPKPAPPAATIVAQDAPHTRPQVVWQSNARPAIFPENKSGTANIGPIAIDARWSNYGAYLQRLIDHVQIQWEQLVIKGKIYPPTGSTVEVKFVLDAEGKIARIVNVDNQSSEQAGHACVNAITDSAPYGAWTSDMKAMLGDQQEMTFRFFYQ